jgi:hypothetical protein
VLVVADVVNQPIVKLLLGFGKGFHKLPSET